MTLTYRDLLDSIQARAALLHAAARNRPAADVPPILHADHEPALRRVIDDSAANVQGAESTGMTGYCFADGDVARLRAYLDGLTK